MIPDTNPNYHDLVDVLTQASTKTIEREDKDGTVVIEQVLDEDKLWWKTLDVSSEKFSRTAFEVMEWERQAQVAYYNMPKERADQIANDIIQVGNSYRRSFDAKGSESRRDKHNAKSTIFDKVGRNKVEKVYSTKTQAKKSIADIFMGKDRDDDMEND